MSNNYERPKPSYINPVTGSRYWFKNNEYIENPLKAPADWGVLHRIDGPAAEYTIGTKEYYLNGKLHRTDGPADENVSGNNFWYLNGKLHRTDGPAAEYANGHKSWWLNGKKLTEEDYNNSKEYLNEKSRSI